MTPPTTPDDHPGWSVPPSLQISTSLRGAVRRRGNLLNMHCKSEPSRRRLPRRFAARNDSVGRRLYLLIYTWLGMCYNTFRKLEFGGDDMVERAYINDIAALTALRLEFLQEDCGELNEEVISKLAEALPAYFEKNLNHNIFCYLIREKENVVACAFLLIDEKPASPMFITGRTGTVLNVYTKPICRHKGYATAIMKMLLQDAVEMNLSSVELKATDAGYNLYKSVGFTDDVSKYHCMKWHKA